MHDDKTTSITPVMTTLPIETGRQNDSVDSILNTKKSYDAYLYDAAVIMTKYERRLLPIVKDNVLLGIVTVTDLAHRTYKENKEDPCLYAIARSRFLGHNM